MHVGARQHAQERVSRLRCLIVSVLWREGPTCSIPQILAPSATSNHQKKIGMTAVGFEPTQLALVELESTPLDHSGKLSLRV